MLQQFNIWPRTRPICNVLFRELSFFQIWSCRQNVTLNHIGAHKIIVHGLEHFQNTNTHFKIQYFRKLNLFQQLDITTTCNLMVDFIVLLTFHSFWQYFLFGVTRRHLFFPQHNVEGLLFSWP